MTTEATTTTSRMRERTVRWDDPAQARAESREMSGRQWLEGIKSGAVSPPPAAQMLGIELQEVDDGRVLFQMEPHEMHYNPAGTVHGGVLTTLADTAMTTAVISQLPPGSWAPTIELKLNFIKPVTEATGRIFATGRAIHVGGATAVAEVQIRDGEGRLLAHGTSTCAVRRDG